MNCTSEGVGVVKSVHYHCGGLVVPRPKQESVYQNAPYSISKLQTITQSIKMLGSDHTEVAHTQNRWVFPAESTPTLSALGRVCSGLRKQTPLLLTLNMRNDPVFICACDL